MGFLETKEISSSGFKFQPTTLLSQHLQCVKYKVEEKINQGFHKKGFITKEARRCIFHLEFRTHTIEEATKLCKV